mgnify:CR=1 FL=1
MRGCVPPLKPGLGFFSGVGDYLDSCVPPLWSRVDFSRAWGDFLIAVNSVLHCNEVFSVRKVMDSWY